MESNSPKIDIETFSMIVLLQAWEQTVEYVDLDNTYLLKENTVLLIYLFPIQHSHNSKKY